MNATCDSGCTACSSDRSTAGACSRSAPNQPCALISASSARIRAGRSGWPGTSCASTSSSRSQSARRELSSIAHTVIACPRVRSDLVVVGAGAAGLFAALTAAREGARVTLVSARPLAETASYWAQGGAAAALALDDSPELHLQDTLDRRPRPHAARRRRGADRRGGRPRRASCSGFGVQFDADRRGDLALGLEGGHSRRRIIHAGGSATGRRILRALSAAAAEHANIDVLEGRRVAGLLSGGGVQLGDGAHAASPRHDPRHRRRRRAVVAHDEPARLVRLRPPARPRGRRAARRPRVHAVPSHRGRRASRAARAS